jgi:hypothetical protein
MPFDTVVILSGVVVVFAAFGLIVAYVNHIAAGPGFDALDVVSDHHGAHGVVRADTAPRLIDRREIHGDHAEPRSASH